MSRIGQGRLWSEIVFREMPLSYVVEALTEHVHPSMINEALQRTDRHSRRIRRLPAASVVWLVLLIAIFSDLDVPAVWRQLAGVTRMLLAATLGRRPPSKSSLSQARTRLGARSMRSLFRLSAKTVACPQTRGCFYQGMRLVAIDGVHFEIPDTQANHRAFGRPATRRNDEHVPGAYPQVHAICLVEAGTHVICDAILKQGKRSEYAPALYLLRQAPPGSLLMWDRGFYGYSAVRTALDHKLHLLGPAKSSAVYHPLQTNHDGSYLAKMYPSPKARRHDVDGIVVRVIEYTLEDPSRPGHHQRHRLYTTLLDEDVHQAQVLVTLYHARWEIELANDEIKTHLLTKDRPTHLRSRTPKGVIQEFYGLVIAYNAIRCLMHQAALRVDIDPRRLSFTHTYRVVRDCVALMRQLPVGNLPNAYNAMLDLIASERLPERDNRINPRVIKKKMSSWAKKRACHYNIPPPQKPFCEAVVILK